MLIRARREVYECFDLSLLCESWYRYATRRETAASFFGTMLRLSPERRVGAADSGGRSRGLSNRDALKPKLKLVEGDRARGHKRNCTAHTGDAAHRIAALSYLDNLKRCTVLVLLYQ